MAISKKGNKRDQPLSGFENVDEEPHKKVKNEPHELQIL